MKNNKKTLKASVDEIKSCFQELGISVIDLGTRDRKRMLITTVGDESFLSLVILTYQGKTRRMKIQVVYPEISVNTSREELLRAINFANWQLMDIGHFSFDYWNNRVCFHTSIELYGDKSEREQIIVTLMRAIWQAVGGFRTLLRMLVSDPVKVMAELAQERTGQRESEPILLRYLVLEGEEK
jgi:hypothetical protein